jgi:hypothetical protein
MWATILLLSYLLASVTVGGAVSNTTALSIDKAGQYTLEFSSSGLVSAISDQFTIVHAVATHLFVEQSPTGSTVAGVPFPTQPIIIIRDFSLNTVSNWTQAVAVSLRGTSELLKNASTVLGIASFEGVFLKVAAASNTLDFQSGSFAVSTTLNFTIAHAPPFKLTMERQPSSSVSMVAFKTQPSIAVRDEFSNLCTSDSTTSVALTLLPGSLGGFLAGSVSVTAVAGIVRWPNPLD